MQYVSPTTKAYGYIYKITNNLTGQSYIGRSINPESRYKSYISLCCRGQYKLYKALRDYGINNFSWSFIDTASTFKGLCMLEEDYIYAYNSVDDGYNCIYNDKEARDSKRARRKPRKVVEDIIPSTPTVPFTPFFYTKTMMKRAEKLKHDLKYRKNYRLSTTTKKRHPIGSFLRKLDPIPGTK